MPFARGSFSDAASNWIARGKKNGSIKKGGLHKSLGVPQGQKIPPGEIASAAKSPGKVGKQARLAESFAKMRKG